MKPIRSLAMLSLAMFAPTAFAADGWKGSKVGIEADIDGLPRVTQELVPAPAVPEHDLIREGGPRIVQISMTIQEKEIEVEPGVFTWAMTYDGHVPGPMIVVHEGDHVELTLKNPSTNTLPHNIDFHAATGALGGGGISLINPGEEVVFRWKAIKPGTFVYHCAPGGVMVPWHVVHGMNGAVMVIPKDGLRDPEGNQIKYDRAYYIGEQDYYIPKDANGKYKRYKTPAQGLADELEVMRGLVPSHVVFGESTSELTGKNALTAKVGETVLFLHSQSNRVSYPHLIGGHGDFVWERGNLADAPVTDIESWVIAAGSTGAFTYKFLQPGLYVYLSHNLIEAFILGAAAHVNVEGEWNNDLMEQVKAPTKIK